MTNSSLLEKAKKLKEELQKRYDEVLAELDDSERVQTERVQTELGNLSYAIGGINDVIEGLECNE